VAYTALGDSASATRFATELAAMREDK